MLRETAWEVLTSPNLRQIQLTGQADNMETRIALSSRKDTTNKTLVDEEQQTSNVETQGTMEITLTVTNQLAKFVASLDTRQIFAATDNDTYTGINTDNNRGGNFQSSNYSFESIS